MERLSHLNERRAHSEMKTARRLEIECGESTKIAMRGPGPQPAARRSLPLQ